MESSVIDGPRAVCCNGRTQEFDALRKLEDVVFRPGMPEQYPQLFNRENWHNLRVCFDKDTCVSHVGMVQREAVILGCSIRVCCIGAVATHPDYRSRGLASQCFDDAVSKARRDGVDLMIVSGGRGLYTRNGCQHIGQDYRYKLEGPASLVSALQVKVSEMSDDELDLVTSCYRREPVRFVREPSEYAWALQSGWSMNSPSEFIVIRSAAHNDFMGYLVIRRCEPGSQTSVVEYAGDRDAVTAAMIQLALERNITSLSFHVLGSDTLMQHSCAASGILGAPSHSSGTFKLINFPQLMCKMRPLLNEVLGERLASRFRFRSDEIGHHFELDGEELILNDAEAVRMVFGSIEGVSYGDCDSATNLVKTLHRILPLPALWYGINYV